MRFINLKKTVLAGAFGVVALLGTTEIANAQSRRDYERERQRIEYQRRIEEQRRQAQQRVWNQQNRNNDRWRVYRNGSYYQTNQRGVELLRQAVNRGYQEGFLEGQRDRRSRRGGSYYNSNVYRSGNYGYQRYVDSSQYQYYFQQGFQRGYEDGYNSRNQYGSYRNGSGSILGAVLNTILNIRQY